MPRLLFEKTGNAVWMSHLDLMRLMQRAFKRAGLPLKHTQGFNPRPSVSIALPLSVGVQSKCELLDFELDGQEIPFAETKQRLNAALVEGVKVLDVYDNGRKIRDIALLGCVLELEYDALIPENAQQMLTELFTREQLTVEKRGKNGVTQQDIIPMIRKFDIVPVDGNTLRLSARICCQNPTLNPAQIAAAIALYLPQCSPDFVTYTRMEVYDQEEKVFR